MDKMRIAEDTPSKLVLEKSLAASDIWRGWGKSLISPLLVLAISSIALFTENLRTWWLWLIFVGAFIVEVVMLGVVLTYPRRISVTIDLHSRTATRIEKLVIGKEEKYEIALDQVSRILIHSEEGQHSPKITIWLDSQNHPRLEIVNNNDLLSLIQGSYIESPSEDGSEVKSLDIFGRKIGEFLEKPVVSKLTDYQGNTISEEIRTS